MKATAIHASDSLLPFVVLTFSIAWLFWWPLAAASHGGFALFLPLSGVASYAPSLSALLLAYHQQGWSGLRQLLGGLLRWRFGVHWYLAILILPGLVVAPGLLVFAETADYAALYPLSWREVGTILLMVLLVGGPLNEELGWRGYLLPRLQRRLGAWRASLLLGLIWSCWHLPLFFTLGSVQAGVPFNWYLLQLTALSVLMTWIYNGTGGSLGAMVLLHALFNTTLYLVQPAWQAFFTPSLQLLVATLWGLALGVRWLSGPQLSLGRPIPPEIK